MDRAREDIYAQSPRRPLFSGEILAAELVQERGRERFGMEDREYRMASMNCLTNATNLTVALIQSDLIKITGQEHALHVVRELHDEMMTLHNPNANEPGK